MRATAQASWLSSSGKGDLPHSEEVSDNQQRGLQGQQPKGEQHVSVLRVVSKSEGTLTLLFGLPHMHVYGISQKLFGLTITRVRQYHVLVPNILTS